MVGTHRATYSSVPQTAQTSPIGWEVTGAGVLRDAVRSPAVLHSEGEIPEASNDPTAARADSPPPIRASGLEAYPRWFQTSEGESDEDWDRVKSETESVLSTVEGSGHCSPWGASFNSPVAWSTRSPRSMGWETQKRRGRIPPHAATTNRQSTSFVNNKYFPIWFTFSQDGDDADRIPCVCTVADYSLDFDEELKNLDRAIEYSITQEEASRPQLPGISRSVHSDRRRESLKKHEYNRGSSWVELGDDEDQLAPIPTGWKEKQSSEREGEEPQVAVGIHTKGPAERATRVFSMAATVPDQSSEAKKREKHSQTAKQRRRVNKAYMRSPSQIPEGGWFRHSTASIATETSSDSDSVTSGTLSDSNSTNSDALGSSKRKSSRKRSDRRKLKKAMVGIKLKPPFVWDAKPDLDVFDHWTYEVDTWAELTGLKDSLVLKLMINFMSGAASKFFMNHVATDQRRWTVKKVYKALFEYCFPVDFKLRLREKLMEAHQGKNTVRDFVRDIRSLANRFPDVTERHLVQIFWDGVRQYIRLKWLDRGLNPEESSLHKLVKTAVRFEKAREALIREQSERGYLSEERAKERYQEYSEVLGEDAAALSLETSSEIMNRSSDDETSMKPGVNSKSSQWLSEEDRLCLRAEGRCFKCAERGHIGRDCPQDVPRASQMSVAAAQYKYLSEDKEAGRGARYSSEDDGSSREDEYEDEGALESDYSSEGEVAGDVARRQYEYSSEDIDKSASSEEETW